MIFSPSDVRLAVQNPSALVTRRSRRASPGGVSFQGDPTAVKLESILRRYHRGATVEEALAQAEASFSDWRTNARLATRAETAIQMLETYLSYDEQFRSGDVIELFRRSQVELGGHIVRVRRDVLFFGLNGHTLRNISWRKDELSRQDLHLLLCPVVISVDEEVGRGRLAELQYWQLRPQTNVSVDIGRCRDLVEQLAGYLDEANRLMIEEGLADEG